MLVAVQLIVFMVIPVIVLIVILLLRSRERMRLLEVVRAASKDGHPLAPEVVAKLPGARPVPTPARDTRRGVVLVAFGLGMGLIGLCAYFVSATVADANPIAQGLGVAALGMIPLAVGIAFVSLGWAGKHHRDDDQ